MRQIRVPVDCFRKRVKKRGVSTVKVSGEHSRLLSQYGWTLVHRGSSYAYMLPPSEDRSTWYVEITIPDEDEIKTLAERLHAAGQDWQGEAFGWRWRYRARRTGVHACQVFSARDNREWTETLPFDYPAEFQVVGHHWPWHYSFRWEAAS